MYIFLGPFFKIFLNIFCYIFLFSMYMVDFI